MRVVVVWRRGTAVGNPGKGVPIMSVRPRIRVESNQEAKSLGRKIRRSAIPTIRRMVNNTLTPSQTTSMFLYGFSSDRSYIQQTPGTFWRVFSGISAAVLLTIRYRMRRISKPDPGATVRQYTRLIQSQFLFQSMSAVHGIHCTYQLYIRGYRPNVYSIHHVQVVCTRAGFDFDCVTTLKSRAVNRGRFTRLVCPVSI